MRGGGGGGGVKDKRWQHIREMGEEENRSEEDGDGVRKERE